MPDLVVDLAPAVIVLVAMLVMRGTAVPETGRDALTVPELSGSLGLEVVIAGSLALRRRTPVAAYAAGTAGLAVEALWLGPGPLSPFANLIGLYGLGLHAGRRRAPLGVVVAPLGVWAYFAGKGQATTTAPMAVLCVWLLVWAAGYGSARRREELAAHRRMARREAAAGERLRIARELHDVMGHTVNAMLVQAGAGRMVLDSDPERARELMISVEDTGRTALAELDRLLGVLRDGSGEPPGLADIGRLARTMTDAGMTVRLRVAAEPGSLPLGVELSAYRIAQEALTNALRHGRAAAAEVVMERRHGRLVVAVTDTGRGPAPGYRAGRGLLGVSERVAAFGGSADHGPGPDGRGFTLHAELPLP
ncbi:sensor histidine kinase [Streptomyces cavernae]|uniref:sensor histidine kinase n=1 Tax=Streptomyces cavernae TaxID=2259034 RepID=UPI00139184EC|nr:histidine kinase [Streptomyces cavernae]